MYPKIDTRIKAMYAIFNFYAAFDNLTAHTLNSGIPEIGSKAALVSSLAAASAKWNGMKIVPDTAFEEIFILMDFIISDITKK